MSDSIKKYAEMYEQKLEDKLIKKGFGEIDSHDEEHVRSVVLKHFDLKLTDDWSNDCDHYIYEEDTSDGYTVYVSTQRRDAPARLRPAGSPRRRAAAFRSAWSSRRRGGR